MEGLLLVCWKWPLLETVDWMSVFKTLKVISVNQLIFMAICFSDLSSSINDNIQYVYLDIFAEICFCGCINFANKNCDNKLLGKINWFSVYGPSHRKFSAENYMAKFFW